MPETCLGLSVAKPQGPLGQEFALKGCKESHGATFQTSSHPSGVHESWGRITRGIVAKRLNPGLISRTPSASNLCPAKLESLTSWSGSLRCLLPENVETGESPTAAPDNFSFGPASAPDSYSYPYPYRQLEANSKVLNLRQGPHMVDSLDFLGGIFLGTFLGSLAALIYHVRQTRQEVRRSYVQLSLAQMEITTLKRTLESHLNSLSNEVDLLSPNPPDVPDSASVAPSSSIERSRKTAATIGTSESARRCIPSPTHPITGSQAAGGRAFPPE